MRMTRGLFKLALIMFLCGSIAAQTNEKAIA
jgi:hypothetical protein